MPDDASSLRLRWATPRPPLATVLMLGVVRFAVAGWLGALIRRSAG